MSTPISRTQSDVYSASQIGTNGPIINTTYPIKSKPSTINYFLLPNLIVHIVGLAALIALWYYLR